MPSAGLRACGEVRRHASLSPEDVPGPWKGGVTGLPHTCESQGRLSRHAGEAQALGPSGLESLDRPEPGPARTTGMARGPLVPQLWSEAAEL